MSDLLTPDICVIGGGSGGLSVAAAAAAFGVDVVLIEGHLMGGDCLNFGCVPSKALLAAGKAAATVRKSAAFGVSTPEPVIDFGKAHGHVQSVIASIAPHDSVERFEGLGVTVLQNHARFVDPVTVEAGNTRVKARRFVIATGSKALIPSIPGLATVDYLTNESVFTLQSAPEHLLIIGAGPIGLEMAQAHRRLGAKVTVVEAQKALAKDDPELTPIVLEALRAEGIEIVEDCKVTRAVKTATGVTLHGDLGNGSCPVFTGSHVLVAAGRSPATDGLGLEKAGIAFDSRGIKVDDGLRTSNKRVFAIGDVAGGPQFTHAAGYQAGLVIRSILFKMPVKMNKDIMPWVTYTSPELGHVGLSEAEARARHGDKIKVLRAEFNDNDRARAEGMTVGALKLIAGPGGRLLGADVAGHQAGEIVNLLSLGVSKKLTMKDLAGFIAPYPTLGELVRRAAISYYAEAPRNVWVRRVIRLLRVC